MLIYFYYKKYQKIQTKTLSLFAHNVG